jgi:HK97 gp10 family phage protein
VITVETYGFKELDAMLTELPKRVVTNILRRSLRRAARPIRDLARAKAPVKTGLVRRSITILSVRLDRDGLVVAKIGIRRPKVRVRAPRAVKGLAGKTKMRVINDPYYGRFLEFGTVKMRAQPFLRPALDVAGPESVNILRDAVGAELLQLHAAPVQIP